MTRSKTAAQFGQRWFDSRRRSAEKAWGIAMKRSRRKSYFAPARVLNPINDYLIAVQEQTWRLGDLD